MGTCCTALVESNPQCFQYTAVENHVASCFSDLFLLTSTEEICE